MSSIYSLPFQLSEREIEGPADLFSMPKNFTDGNKMPAAPIIRWAAKRLSGRRGDVPGRLRDDSFEAVVLPHLDAAYNLARWLMRERAAAEDVVQEAMLRALTYFPSFRGGNARAWLLQIVRNAAYASKSLDRGKEHTPLPEEDTPARPELASSADDPEAALIRTRDTETVRALIAGLPLELREPLVLRELEELSYKEIAGVTGVPIGTVLSRLWRARRLLARDAAAGQAA
jgi:RNA polymerase sigma-70 factor (ECF subfamily)